LRNKLEGFIIKINTGHLFKLDILGKTAKLADGGDVSARWKVKPGCLARG